MRNYRSLNDIDFKFLILDPSNDDLIKSYIRFRLSSNSYRYTDEDFNKEVTRIKKDILVSILMLKDLSPQFKIHVKFHNDFIIYRQECLSNCIIISYYNGFNSFTESYFYDISSMHYNSHKRKFVYQYDVYKNGFVFDYSIDKSDEGILNELQSDFSLDEILFRKSEKIEKLNKYNFI